VTESGIVESQSRVVVGNGNDPRVRPTPAGTHAPSVHARRNLKFGGPGGGGGAPGGPRASWPGPRGGGVETLSYAKARILGSDERATDDLDDARLSRDEREFLKSMASQRRMVSDRAALAASVAELGLLPRGTAPITTQPGSDVVPERGAAANGRPTGLAAGGPKQVSAVDYLHSGAPVAPVRASWNPDASPSREEAAFDPARSLRESLERTRPRTATGVPGSRRLDENDPDPNNPNNPWVDRNAALRAAVRNRLRPSSARSQVSSLGDLDRLEQTVDALRRSYRRADPPARGRGGGGGGFGGGVGALDDAADAAARKIADREARDWEWQSSWQWEWQQELDVETRGRRAMEPPAPARSPAKVHPSPEKRPAVGTFECRTSPATSTPTKAAATTPTKAAATPVRTPPGARSAAKPPRSPAFVGSPAPTAAARRSPFKEPTAAAPVAVSSSAPAEASPESEPEPKVKFGRRARGDVEASKDPRTVPPSPPMPSPPTLTERSPPTGRPGASSSYAERREAYRESRAAVAPAESVGGDDGGPARPSVPPRRAAFDSDDSDAPYVGEDIETLPDELSSGGEDSDIEVVELVEIDGGAGGGNEEAMWRPASSKYV